MSTKLPYVVQPGSIAKIFEKVREAQTPERFTGDFLSTKLGFRGGNYKQFVPLAKKLGFLGSDSRPTDIYKRFREEIINIPQLVTLFRELIQKGRLRDMMSEIVVQSRVEFNVEDDDDIDPVANNET